MDQSIAWGNPDWGGDCSAVQDQLRNVQQIQCRILVVHLPQSWQMDRWLPGAIQSGAGDCSAVQDQLRNVQQIQATDMGAFAAILADGSVVAWGDPEWWR